MGPVAIILPSEQEVILGASARLDGSNSQVDDGFAATYTWTFTQVPVGSKLTSTDLVAVEVDNSIVEFSPDVTGIFRVQLVVDDGVKTSDPVVSSVESRRTAVPYHRDYAPDASFIWNYLPDTYRRVDGRERIESIWSAFIQIVGAEYLKLFEADYSKSIQTIQGTSQRRWSSYEIPLELSVDEVSFLLGPELAGTSGVTYLIDPKTVLPFPNQPDATDTIQIPLFEPDIAGLVPGTLLRLSARGFTLRRTAYFSFGGNKLASTFIGDQANIPAAMANLPWRVGYTLISNARNFEEEGVTIGDSVLVEVTRTDVNLVGSFLAQVIAVDRNRLGLVLNLKELVDGELSGGLSTDDQLSLADAMRVPGFVYVPSTASYTETDQVAQIKERVGSLAFQRAYWFRELTPRDEINVGPFVISVRPRTIYRMSKLPVPEMTVSIPYLQEYLRQPTYVERDGQLYQVAQEEFFPRDRLPYIFVENTDYTIDGADGVRGSCSLAANNPVIYAPLGYFLERRLEEGDQLEVQIGVSAQRFTVRKIIDSQNVEVYPAPNKTASGLAYTIVRRISSTFLRFNGSRIDRRRSAPARLWAEVIFLDNDPVIEANFGRLVGVTREDWKTQRAKAPYLNVVQGLMYALVRGPSVGDLRLAAQILVGLPFSKRRGIVREVIENFEIVPQTGAPKRGRILIEALDDNDAPTGQVDVYFYPQGDWVFDPDTAQLMPVAPALSGLATNPDTGLKYRAGDIVPQFSILANGVQVADYQSNAEEFLRQARVNPAVYLTRYHSFGLIINSSVVAAPDIDLAARFIREARPTYTRFSPNLLKALADPLILEEDLHFRAALRFFDNPALGLPTAVKFDYPTGAPGDFVTANGEMYSLYRVGDDLVTAALSSAASSAAGGFVNVQPGQLHDTPYLTPFPATLLLVIYGGPNAGTYTVGSIDNDQGLSLIQTSTGPASFAAATEQSFAIYQSYLPVRFYFNLAVTQGSDLVTLPGVFSAGVTEGDEFYFWDGGGLVSSRYQVVKITGSSVKLNRPVSEPTDSYTGFVLREPAIPQLDGYKLTVDMVGATNALVVQAPGDLEAAFYAAFIRPGYSIQVENGPTFSVIDWEPSTRTATVLPAAAANIVAANARVIIPSRQSDQLITFDLMDRAPGEEVLITLHRKAGGASTTAGSDLVTTDGDMPATISVQPGDFFVLYEGADSSVDVGYGPGVYPILDVQVGVFTIQLSRTLTATDGPLEYGYRRRRTT